MFFCIYSLVARVGPTVKFYVLILVYRKEERITVLYWQKPNFPKEFGVTYHVVTVQYYK